jgi:uncharacterized protein
MTAFAYPPAWLTGLALGALSVGYWILLRRPLGVSGVLARFSRISEELEFDRGNAVLAADAAALEAAISAATAEAFAGSDALADASAAAAIPPEEPARDAPRECAPTPPLSAHLTFLVAVAAGGLAAAVLRGGFGAGMGEAFARHVGSGPVALASLAAGGVLVGFGTSLCGGCSAGHGLTGCGRLAPASLVATGTFFGSAVLVSTLLAGALR